MLEIKEIIDVVNQVQKELCIAESKVNEIVDIQDSDKEQYYLGNILFCKNILSKLSGKLEDDESLSTFMQKSLTDNLGKIGELFNPNDKKPEEIEKFSEMYDFQSDYVKAMMKRGFSFDQSLKLYETTMNVSSNND
ncbi:hypothetical protein [Apilactobacillus timberlakei]|uniref:hypothetical protein n=1 Tax=Apilactobacillus timberlakei TaxID=2008380 RepID=UPI00112AC3BB|nr:hypothetical protein [Apilactobacillus timberlakei]TPR12270.1 hypothetical protein DYZ97_07260 [Apilactobacillus timberlakei]